MLRRAFNKNWKYGATGPHSNLREQQQDDNGVSGAQPQLKPQQRRARAWPGNVPTPSDFEAGLFRQADGQLLLSLERSDQWDVQLAVEGWSVVYLIKVKYEVGGRESVNFEVAKQVTILGGIAENCGHEGG
jgi:hypothetical protein